MTVIPMTVIPMTVILMTVLGGVSWAANTAESRFAPAKLSLSVSFQRHLR